MKNLWLAPITALSVTLAGFGSCGSDEVRCTQEDEAPSLAPGGYALIGLRCRGLGRGGGLSFSSSSSPNEAISVVSQAYYHPGDPNADGYAILVRGHESAVAGDRANLDYTITYMDAVAGGDQTGIGTIYFSFTSPSEPNFRLKARASAPGVEASERISIAPGAEVTVEATNESGAPLSDVDLAWLARGFTASESNVRRGLANGGGAEFDGTSSKLTDVPSAARAYEVIARDSDGRVQVAQAVVEIAGQSEPLSVQIVQTSTGTPTFGELFELRADASGGVPPYSYAWNHQTETVSGDSASFRAEEGTMDLSVVVTDAVGSTARAERSITTQREAPRHTLTITVDNRSSALGGVRIWSSLLRYNCVVMGPNEVCEKVGLTSPGDVELHAGASGGDQGVVDVAWSGGCTPLPGDSSAATVHIENEVSCTVTFSDHVCDPRGIEPLIDVTYAAGDEPPQPAPAAMKDGRLLYYVPKQTSVFLSSARSHGAERLLPSWKFEGFGLEDVPAPVPGQAHLLRFSLNFAQMNVAAKLRALDPKCPSIGEEAYDEARVDVCSWAPRRNGSGNNAQDLPIDCFGE